MNNLTVLTELKFIGGGFTIKSVELVDVINQFRKLEDNKAELKHDDFMKKIKKELEILKNLGISLGNFSESTYINTRGKKYPCFEMTRDGMMQMLNSESTLVRYKTIEYINKLEQDVEELHSIAISNETQTERINKVNKWAKQSIYLTDEIHDRKSIRKFIREYDKMKLDECIEKIVDMTIKMKGSIKHELLDVAIKELKTIDAALMKDTIKHTYIKDTAIAGIVTLQDVKIGKYKKRINRLEQVI